MIEKIDLEKAWSNLKLLYLDLSYLMKDVELYISTLNSKSFEKYSKISYTINLSKDERETKRSEGHDSNLGVVHEVVKVTRGCISNRVVSLSKSTFFFSNLN